MSLQRRILATASAGISLALASASAGSGGRLLTTEELLSRARGAVSKLGVYRARLTKTERVAGKLFGPAVLEVWIRETPRAIRVDFVRGPNAGRRILFNEALKRDRMLVREAGLLGAAPLWVDIDSTLVRRETNHTVAELGFGFILDLVSRDLEAGKRFGGHRRRDTIDGGRACQVHTAPANAIDLYAAKTTLCFDEQLGLPVVIEVHDRTGLLERYLWSDVKPLQRVPADFFTPRGAGM